jgi:hypothetical protein
LEGDGMNIENLFKNEEQLARDARGTAEFLADDKMFDDISEEFEFKAGAQAGFREGIKYAIAIIDNHMASHMIGSCTDKDV